jgi:ABC-type nickel/cobalt efflux system permease component RcnA
MARKSIVFKRRLRFSLIVLVSQMLLMALAIAWGVNLILIAQHGGLYSIETNPLVLYGEIAATVLIIIFACVVIYLEIVRMRSKRQGERESQEISDSQDISQEEKSSESIDNIDDVESVEDLFKS